MKTSTLSLSALLIFLSAVGGLPQATRAQTSDAESTAIDAYRYFYPLVLMDVTRLQMTNVAEPVGTSAPMNAFAHVREYPPADFRAIVRPNFDTLYSALWMDLTAEPVILSFPASNGRYYLAPALDMWTDVFFSPGTRTTGNEAAHFAYVPPGWEGELPAEVNRVDVPTKFCWILGRTKTDGPADYYAVHAFQDGMRVTRLSDWGKSNVPAVVGHVDPSIDMHTPPMKQVDGMTGEQFFEYAARLLALHGSHITDQDMLARLRRIGIEPGEELDFGSLSADVKAALNSAPAAAQQSMQVFVPHMARITNGWSMNTESMGVYGNNYLKRAVIAQQGLGANVPEDAIYPFLQTDGDGHPIAAGGEYTLHFDKDAMPPVNAFWSITLYDGDGFPVANPLQRQNLAQWMPLEFNADGSLDLYESPGADKESNWLPAPATGDWNLTMRLYAPQSAVAAGTWNPPPVQRTDGNPVAPQR